MSFIERGLRLLNSITAASLQTEVLEFVEVQTDHNLCCSEWWRQLNEFYINLFSDVFQENDHSYLHVCQ